MECLSAFSLTRTGPIWNSNTSRKGNYSMLLLGVRAVVDDWDGRNIYVTHL